MVMDMKLWIQEHFVPVVCVAASPDAEAICQKNGLSVVDILRPYSHVRQLNSLVKVADSTTKLQEIKIRFHALSSIYQPRTEGMEDHLKHLLNASAQKYARKEPTPNILQHVQSGRSVLSHCQGLGISFDVTICVVDYGRYRPPPLPLLTTFLV
jgi:hypothetical protein